MTERDESPPIRFGIYLPNVGWERLAQEVLPELKWTVSDGIL